MYIAHETVVSQSVGLQWSTSAPVFILW